MSFASRRPRSLLTLIALAGGITLAGAGAPLAAQTPEVMEVAPTSLDLVRGGAARTVRVTVNGTAEITGVRFLQDEASVSGFQATPRRVELRTVRGATWAVYDVAIAASAPLPPGSYAPQLVFGRAFAAIPLDLRVSAPRTISAPTASRTSEPLEPLRPVGDVIRTSGPGSLALRIGCGRSVVFPKLDQTTDAGEVSLSQASGPVVIEICATEGFSRYRWTFEGISHQPYSGEAARSISGSGEQVAPNRFVVTIPTPQRRQRVRIRVEVDQANPALPKQGGRLWFSPTLPGLVILPAPVLERYWVHHVRPPAAGRLENDGIFDPVLTEDPDDGVFWVHGRNLDAPDLRIATSTGTGSYLATILERTSTAAGDVVKAQLRDFRSGGLTVSHAGGLAQSSQPVRRLGYWPFPTSDVGSMLQGLSCSLGSPRGTATITLADGTPLRYTVGPIEGYGFSADILDLNSSSVTLTAESGGQPGREVVLTTRIDFETTGREFDGTFLPTISWWACDSFRVETSECSTLDLGCFGQALGSALGTSLACANPAEWQERSGPGPEVPFAGDLVAPRATFRTTLAIDPAGGTLAAKSVDAAFSAQITLQAGAGVVPLGPLETLLLDQANEQLQAVADESGFGPEIAGLVNDLAQNAGVGRLRYVHRLPDGRIYMEYER